MHSYGRKWYENPRAVYNSRFPGGWFAELGMTTQAEAKEPDCSVYYFRRSRIKFLCGAGLGEPVFMEERSCEYSFKWVTELVCEPGEVPEPMLAAKCRVTPPGGLGTFDFSPLIRTWDNWVVESENAIYHVNVCNSLVKTRTMPETCHDSRASICAVPRSGGLGGRPQPRSLGMPAQPRFRSGELYMQYSGAPVETDELCEPARIVFKCNRAAGLGRPRLIDARGLGNGLECAQIFEWATATACPVRTTVGEACAVRSDTYAFTYDFSSLRGLELPVRDSTSWATRYFGMPRGFTVAICAPVTAAAGSEPTGKSPGNWNEQLTIDEDGSVALHYRNGSTCPDGRAWETRMQFFCDEGDDSELQANATVLGARPDSSNCRVDVDIATPLACPVAPDESSCFVSSATGSEIYDLSVLRREGRGAENWVALGEDAGCGSFYINVCAPLVRNPATQQGLQGCSRYSAVCAVKAGDAQGRSAKSIGAVELTEGGTLPTINQDKSLTLRYAASGRCVSEITLSCEPGNLGEPLYVGLDESSCTYRFEWNTSAACPVADTTGASCAVTDLSTGAVFDFSGVARPDPPYSVDFDVLTSKGAVPEKWSADVALCGPVVASCGADGADQGACVHPRAGTVTLTNTSALGGGKASSMIALDEGRLMLRYTSGGPCLPVFGAPHASGEAMETVIEFVCNRSVAGLSLPKMVDPSAFVPSVGNTGVDPCRLLLEWHTPFACGPIEVPCVAESPSGLQFDLSTLTKTLPADPSWTLNATATADTAAAAIDFNVCRSLPQRKDLGCSPGAAGCVTDSAGGPALGWGLPVSPEWDDGCNTPVMQMIDEDGACQAFVEFVCPSSAVKTLGQPELVELVDSSGAAPTCANGAAAPRCAYQVRWETSPACGTAATPGTLPTVPTTPSVGPAAVDCLATDPRTGETYDLSYLRNAKRNWIVGVEGGGTYQLNVCRSLVPGPANVDCGSAYGACKVGSPSIGFGEQTGPPQVGVDGSLVIKYVGGVPCDAGDREMVERSARLELTCPRDGDGNPIAGVFGNPILRSETKCTVLWAWETSFACAAQQFEQGGCKLTDLVSGDSFDLSRFRGRTFNVSDTTPDTSEPVQFQVAICSNTTACGGANKSGACLHATPPVNLGMANSELVFDAGELRLKYTGGDMGAPTAQLDCTNRTWQTVVDFVCDKDVTGDDLQVSLVETGIVREGSAGDAGMPGLQPPEYCQLKFAVATELACAEPRSMVECVAVADDGETYDLSELAKHDGNWVVVDEREGGKYAYELNVCRAVNYVKENHGGCAGYGACQVSRDGSVFAPKGLGKPQSPRFIDGALTLLYTGGDVCPTGTERSTKIILVCSESLGLPVYVTERDCQYIFTWETPAACSKADSGGGGANPGACSATDSATGLVYDLGRLRGVVADAEQRVLGGPNVLWSASLCGEMQCGAGRAEACLDGTDGPTPLTADAGPQYAAGVVSQLYTSDRQCPQDESRTMSVKVVFECDPSLQYPDLTAFPGGVARGIPKFVHADDACVHQIRWKTLYMCTPYPAAVPCSVTSSDGTQAYDLSSLSFTEAGRPTTWTAVEPGGGDHGYTMSVCGPLPPIDAHPECAGAGMCQLKHEDGSTFAYAAGTVTQGPQVNASGVLTITYTAPLLGSWSDKCSGGSFRSTQITFVCAADGDTGSPALSSQGPGCQYNFIWRTSAACPEPVRTETITSATTAATTVPVTDAPTSTVTTTTVASSSAAKTPRVPSIAPTPGGGVVSSPPSLAPTPSPPSAPGATVAPAARPSARPTRVGVTAAPAGPPPGAPTGSATGVPTDGKQPDGGGGDPHPTDGKQPDSGGGDPHPVSTGKKGGSGGVVAAVVVVLLVLGGLAGYGLRRRWLRTRAAVRFQKLQSTYNDEDPEGAAGGPGDGGPGDDAMITVQNELFDAYKDIDTGGGADDGLDGLDTADDV